MNMKKILYIALAAVIALVSCNKFDDSNLWDKVDKTYNQLTEIGKQIDALNAQLDVLSAIVQKGAVTDITKDAEGNVTLKYKDSEGVEHSLSIATKDDVVTGPFLGVKEEGKVLYWTMTNNGKTDFLKDVDGAKIPVAGKAPQFAVDKDGFWTLNGVKVLDSYGNPVKSEGKVQSLITSVTILESGDAKLVLGDGSEVVLPVFNKFNMTMKVGEQVLEGSYNVIDIKSPLVIACELTGKEAADVIVKIKRQNNLEAVYDAAKKEITVTFAEGFTEGSFAVMLVNSAMDVLIKTVQIALDGAKPEYQGIKTTEDFRQFAQLFNAGQSIDRYRNAEGDVALIADIDLSGVTEWIPIGTAEKPFNLVFNGQGHKVINVKMTVDLSATTQFGLFGNVVGATIKNLVLGNAGDKLTFTGDVANPTHVGAIAADVATSSIEACTNNVDIEFTGKCTNKTLLAFGGIAGNVLATTIGGADAANGCINNGALTTADITNIDSGGNGIQMGGICGFVKGSPDNLISHCVNNGHIAAPTGRGGGIVGTMEEAKMLSCTNNGLVEDDPTGTLSADATAYKNKRMGGLAGGSMKDNISIIEKCINNGTVISHTGCRAGGFVGHNNGMVQESQSNGVVIGKFIEDGANLHGPAWACGYNKSANYIVNCDATKAKVGDLSFKEAPSTAPAANHKNAVRHTIEKYNPEVNTVDWSLDSYYDWKQTSTASLHEAVTYTSYEFVNIPRKMHVLAVDLSNPAIEITTSLANDIVPNPNGNNNSNNGKNIRETLSENCARKRAEGQNIIAGINSGFFDSHDGYPRGVHIENGRPDFVNNLEVRENLVNHKNAFTYFKDGSVNCASKYFVGKVELAGAEIEYFSINDIILRTGSKTMPANLYTNKYKKTPHATHPQLINELSKSALYIVAENTTAANIQVNEGWVEAKIVSVHDGRTTALAEAPYITAENQWVLQLTGTAAEAAAANATVGAAIKVRADVTIDGKMNPILTSNSAYRRFLTNGVDKSEKSDKYDPVTFVGVDKTGKKVYFIVVDGRNKESMGVKPYEMVKIVEKLGCYNMTRFDGGGSSAMWIYEGTAGRVANTPSDSNGERSCMNYMQIRVK